MLNLTKEQKGYIAGIIDGEGSICIHRGVECLKNGERRFFYRPFIKIANSDMSLLIWIKEKLQCGCIQKQRNKNPEVWKDGYILCFSANMIRTFLPQILDCIMVKKRQALIVLEFLKMSHQRTPKGFRLNNDARYVRFHETMKALNLRGVSGKEAKFGGTPIVLSMDTDNTEPSRDLFPGVCNDQKVSRITDGMI